jgi:hypothetical protein
MGSKKSISKTVVGRQELCDLPQLGLTEIRARVDSGAKTTALHAYNIEVMETDGKTGVIKFNTHPENRRRKDGPIITLPFVDHRTVVSSNGAREERYIVRLDVVIGGQLFNTDVTLTSRHKMTFPILLGRNTLIEAGFVIDVSKGYVLGKKTKVKKEET